MNSAISTDVSEISENISPNLKLSSSQQHIVRKIEKYKSQIEKEDERLFEYMSLTGISNDQF